VRVSAVRGDITSQDGRTAALAACPEPDILLNNADGPAPGDFRHWSREDWIAALDMMMLSHIEMMRLTVDGMMARGFGRILNIVSRSVKIPQAELGLSNGARSGLVGFAGGLARQTVVHNVTINNLLPGIFDSDAQREHIRGMLTEGGKSFDEVWQARAEANPARRYGRPAELGAYCAFLCSIHAGFITGQNLLIDGGSYPGTF
jgi:3-oxoacyl-[acyl-carrier protein] reductase